MSDESPDDELSSLYKSIKGEAVFSKVKQGGREKKKMFQSIFDKTGNAANPSKSSRYLLDTSSELTRLNDLLNASETSGESCHDDGEDKFTRASKMRKRSRKAKSVNVFDNILNDDGADARGQEVGGGSSSSSGSSHTPSHSDETLGTDFVTREPFKRPRVGKVKPFSRSQVLAFADEFSSDNETRQRHTSSLQQSSILTQSSSGSMDRPEKFTSEVRGVRRMPERQREVLQNILNPADRPRSNETVDSKLSSDSSTSKNRFRENLSTKSDLIYKNIPGARNSSSVDVPVVNLNEKPDRGKKISLVRKLSRISEVPAAENERGTGGFPPMPTANPAESRELLQRHQRKALEEEYSSSDLTFDSDVVLHSTLRNTPVVKEPRKGRVFSKVGEGNPTRFVMPRNLLDEGEEKKRRQRSPPPPPPGEEQHNNQLGGVGVATVSLHKAKLGRSGKERKVSAAEPRLGSDEVESRNSSRDTHGVDASPQVERQTVGEFTGGERKSESRQTAGESLLPKKIKPPRRTPRSRLLSNASDVLDDDGGEGVSPDASERKGKPVGLLSNSDKIDTHNSRGYDEDCRQKPRQPVTDFGKGDRNSEQAKSSDSLPTGKPVRSQGKETNLDVSRPSVPSCAADNSDRSLSDVPEGKRRKQGTSKGDKINRPNLRGFDGGEEPEPPPLVPDFGNGARNLEPAKSSESSTTGKPVRSRGNKTILDISRPSVPSHAAGNSERSSSDVSEGKPRRTTQGTSKRDKKSKASTIGDKELEWLISQYKFERSSKLKKSDEKLPADKLATSKGDKIQRWVSSRVISNDKLVTFDVSGSKLRQEETSEREETSMHNNDGNADSGPKSPLFNFLKPKLRSVLEKRNEKLPAKKVARTRGDESQTSASSRVFNKDNERVSSGVSGSKRGPEETSKCGETSRSNKDGNTDPESPLFDFVIPKQSSVLEKRNEKLPAKKVARTRADESQTSASSRVFNKDNERVSSGVSGSKRGPEETSKRGETSRRNDGSSDSDPDSPLFNFLKPKWRSELKERNENLPADKLASSRGDESPTSVSSRVFSHDIERVASDVSRSKPRPEETSRRKDGNTDPESPLFDFVKPKQSPELEKAKEKLPANKAVRSRGKGSAGRETADPPSESGAKSRKFEVRGKAVAFKKPAEWVNDRFYEKLLPFFETKYGPLRCFSACEDAVMDLHANVKKALSTPSQRVACVNKVRKILYDVGVIKTPVELMLYSEQYLPNEFMMIATPIQIGSISTGVPYPEGVGLYDDLKLS